MKKIYSYIIKPLIVLVFIWSITFFLNAIIEYNIIFDNISDIEKEDIDFYEKHKNQYIELYSENTDKINMLIDSEKREGKAVKFYENKQIETELDCRMEHISFLELFANKLILTEKYKIEEIKYYCKRTQYYENGKKMLSAQYKHYSQYSYNQNIYHFLKEEISRFYNDIHHLRVYGINYNQLIGESVVYYENIPNGIENTPRGVNVCVHGKYTLSYHTSDDAKLCRKEEYTKYTNNHWNVVEYFPNGRLKSDLTYKNIETDEIIRGKKFNENGRLLIEYVDEGNRILFYNDYAKLYKEIRKDGNKTKSIKMYSSNGDLEYILFFKNDKPLKGFKYEQGKEVPLTNAHIYNIFKIKANVD